MQTPRLPQDTIRETIGPVQIVKTTFTSGHMYGLRNAETGAWYGGSWTKLVNARRRAKQIAAAVQREADAQARHR